MAVANNKTKIIYTIIVLLVLTLAAGFTNIASFTGPFNPITLNVLLMGLSIVGYINSFDLPSAKNCKRRERDKCMANMYERLLGDTYKIFILNCRSVMRLQKRIVLQGRKNG